MQLSSNALGYWISVFKSVLKRMSDEEATEFLADLEATSEELEFPEPPAPEEIDETK